MCSRPQGMPTPPVTNVLRHVTPCFRSISWARRRSSSSHLDERLERLGTSRSLGFRIGQDHVPSSHRRLDSNSGENLVDALGTYLPDTDAPISV
ncbi:hypothetical protein MRX96_045391 [Rhipicephalus microplus]